MIRALFLCMGLLLLAACAPSRTRPAERPGPPPVDGTGRPETSLPQDQRYRDRHDSTPERAAVDIAALAEPVPKAEPRSRYGNKSPYQVLGKTYTVLADSRGYVERGMASWYGNKFHGYATSSLEPYDMYQFSAAHKSLPLPTYVRVTNLDNGKSVVVRINDRGPFHDDRLIDLSFAAAVRIGIWPKGTGRVEVRALEPGQSLAALPKPALHSERPASAIFVQLGAYADRANAERIVERIERERLGAVSVVTTRINARAIHRVRLGPLPSVEMADDLIERITRLGFGVARMVIEE